LYLLKNSSKKLTLTSWRKEKLEAPPQKEKNRSGKKKTFTKSGRNLREAGDRGNPKRKKDEKEKEDTHFHLYNSRKGYAAIFRGGDQTLGWGKSILVLSDRKKDTLS